MPIRDAESYMTPRAIDARLYANRGANGIDGLISTACGLARGAGRPTWALLGDLATGYDVGGLANVGGLPAGAPLRLVVADNGGGRIFEFLPQAGQVERGPLRAPVHDAGGSRLRAARGPLRPRLRRARRPPAS